MSFATEADRRLVANLGKIYTWKIVVESPDGTVTAEYRVGRAKLKEVVNDYPNAIEIKRLKGRGHG